MKKTSGAAGPRMTTVDAAFAGRPSGQRSRRIGLRVPERYHLSHRRNGGDVEESQRKCPAATTDLPCWCVRICRGLRSRHHGDEVTVLRNRGILCNVPDGSDLSLIMASYTSTSPRGRRSASLCFTSYTNALAHTKLCQVCLTAYDRALLGDTCMDLSMHLPSPAARSRRRKLRSVAHAAVLDGPLRLRTLLGKICSWLPCSALGGLSV